MRRFHLRVLALALPAFALSLFLLGCGATKEKDEESDDDTPPVKAAAGSKATGKERVPIKATEFVPLTGAIKLEGNRPDTTALTNALREGMKQDRDYCLSGGDEETTEQEYRIGDNNQVGNVFVWIEPEQGFYFEISEAQLKEVPKQKVMRQPHCAFVPHCEVLFTRYVADNKGTLKPTGQKLQVENDAKVSHNTKTKGGARNRDQNETMGSGSKVDFDVLPENVPFEVSCNIHPWMKAYVRAFNHPYATLSVVGKDSKDQAYGTYKIDKVPLGAKVRLFAWHEKAGFLGDPKGQPIEITKNMVQDFTLKAK